MSILDKFKLRREPVDQTPVNIPVEFRKQESMDERIRRITQHSLSRQAAMEGFETFEEANDFDIPDDPVDPSTPWEIDHDAHAINAMDGGLVERPNLSAERQVELKEKVKSAKARKPKDQIDLEESIASAVAKGIKEGSEPSK